MPALVLGFRPAVSLELETLHVERLQDRAMDDFAQPLRAFRVAAGYDERILIVDPQGAPLEVREDLPLDRLAWRRVR